MRAGHYLFLYGLLRSFSAAHQNVSKFKIDSNTPAKKTDAIHERIGTHKDSCAAKGHSLLAIFRERTMTSVKADLLDLKPCLKIWHSADWQGAHYIWKQSERGEESPSFLLSPAMQAAFPSWPSGTLTTGSNRTDAVTAWRSQMLHTSSGHGLLTFSGVYVMCASNIDGQNNLTDHCRSWVLALPDECQMLGLDGNKRAADVSNLTFERGVTQVFDVDVAITIASKMTGEHYHGPADVISSLLHVDQSLLQNDTVYLHVGSDQNQDYIKEWLTIVGIASDRLVYGDFRARLLYIPEFHMHKPSRAQLAWLQHSVWNAIGFPNLRKRNLLIVSKRQSRGIGNHNTSVMPLAEGYAKAHGLEVWVHDDENLPSVREQLDFFSRAVMVLAPHGAGEVFGIASLPGTCWIEMFPTFWTCETLARMIEMLGHHYTGIQLQDVNASNISVPNADVNATELALAMEVCGNRSGVIIHDL